jgi:hypothetical protein
VYIDYFALRFVELAVSEADELVKINVVMTEPELWRQCESNVYWWALMPKTLDKLLVTMLAFGEVPRGLLQFGLGQGFGAEALHSGFLYMFGH